MPGRFFFAKYSVARRKAFQATLLGLYAQIRDCFVGSRSDGTLAFGAHAKPVSGFDGAHFSVNPEFAAAGQNPVERPARTP